MNCIRCEKEEGEAALHVCALANETGYTFEPVGPWCKKCVTEFITCLEKLGFVLTDASKVK